ncbi:MAG: YceI family protein [Isosphaeraceae bacterium]
MVTSLFSRQMFAASGRSAALICLLASLGGPAQGQTAPAGAQRKVVAASPERVVDTNSSQVLAKVGAEGYGHVHGVNGRLASGWVKLGGTGELVFDMRTFVADLPNVRAALGLTKAVSAGDQRKTTANMLGPDVLDVARHPTARYEVRSCLPLDGQPSGAAGRYRLEGVFTFHGVSRPLTFDTTVREMTTPGLLWMRGSFNLLQTHHGMTPYSALAGLVRVADKVEITGDLILATRTASR